MQQQMVMMHQTIQALQAQLNNQQPPPQVDINQIAATVATAVANVGGGGGGGGGGGPRQIDLLREWDNAVKRAGKPKHFSGIEDDWHVYASAWKTWTETVHVKHIFDAGYVFPTVGQPFRGANASAEVIRLETEKVSFCFNQITQAMQGSAATIVNNSPTKKLVAADATFNNRATQLWTELTAKFQDNTEGRAVQIESELLEMLKFDPSAKDWTQHIGDCNVQRDKLLAIRPNKCTNDEYKNLLVRNMAKGSGGSQVATKLVTEQSILNSTLATKTLPEVLLALDRTMRDIGILHGTNTRTGDASLMAANANVQCYCCFGWGHYARDCTDPAAANAGWSDPTQWTEDWSNARAHVTGTEFTEDEYYAGGYDETKESDEPTTIDEAAEAADATQEDEWDYSAHAMVHQGGRGTKRAANYMKTENDDGKGGKGGGWWGGKGPKGGKGSKGGKGKGGKGYKGGKGQGGRGYGGGGRFSRGYVADSRCSDLPQCKDTWANFIRRMILSNMKLILIFTVISTVLNIINPQGSCFDVTSSTGTFNASVLSSAYGIMPNSTPLWPILDYNKAYITYPLSLLEVAVIDAPAIQASAMVAHALATYGLLDNVTFGLVYDTGATENFIKDISFMIKSSMVPYRKGIKVGNSEVIYSTHWGQARLPFVDYDGNVVSIVVDALYAPDISNNLISGDYMRDYVKSDVFIGQMCAYIGLRKPGNSDVGAYIPLLRRDGMILINATEPRMDANGDESDYIKWAVSNTNCYAMANSTSTEGTGNRDLMHARFGCIDDRKLQDTADATIGMKLTGKRSNCDICPQAKMRAANAPKNATPVNEPGDLVIADDVGPFIESSSKKKYRRDIIDACTGYLYSESSDTLSGVNWVRMIRRFIARVLRPAEIWKPKTVASDGATGFGAGKTGSALVKAWFERHFINRWFSAPRAHYQVGRIERAHAVIQNVSNAMMLRGSAPKKYWPYASDAAVHVLNLTVNKHASRYMAKKLGIPGYKACAVEAMTGAKPPVNSLKVMFCRCYVLDELEIRDSKFDRKGVPAINFGYADTMGYKAYITLLEDEGKIRISQNVIFYEDEFPFAKLQPPLTTNVLNEPTIPGDFPVNSLDEDLGLPEIPIRMSGPLSQSDTSHGVIEGELESGQARSGAPESGQARGAPGG